MIIEKVMLNKYEGPDSEDVTVGKIYEVLPFTYEDDGEYVIWDNTLQQHVVDPEWCTVVEDVFGKRDVEEQPSNGGACDTTEWNGENSLPPVGAYCTAQHVDNSLVRHVKVMAYSDDFV